MDRYELIQEFSPEELEERLDELAAQINRDYEGKYPVLIGILKGAFVFLADLMRRLSFPVQVDFIRLASYGDRVETSGAIRITKDIELCVTDRDVLIVEDIIDTGLTLTWLIEHFQSCNPRSIKVCALIDKLEKRQVNLRPDYVGIHLEKGFVVGYGLDYSEKYRNLPGIYKVKFL
jgi:hypoxanthine phosphoribosyltransferase